MVWDEEQMEEESQRLALLYASMEKSRRTACFERLEQERPRLAEKVLIHLAPLVLLEKQQVEAAKREVRALVWRWAHYAISATMCGFLLWFLFLR